MEHPESSQQQSQDKETLFLDMMNTYQDAIFRFLYFRVGNRAVAVDITQDTFTKVWGYLAGGKEIQYPEAFLYRSAKNALIDYYKKEKSSSLDILMDAGFDPGSTKDTDDILKRDDIQSIRVLMDDMDEDSQQIIYLRFAEEKPIEEIAALYGKTTNAMTVAIHRLVKKIKARYDETHQWNND